jgi:hypothetical protein
MSLFHHKQTNGERETDFVDKLIHVSFGNNYDSDGLGVRVLLHKAKAIRYIKFLIFEVEKSMFKFKLRHFAIQSQKLETYTCLTINSKRMRHKLPHSPVRL